MRQPIVGHFILTIGLLSIALTLALILLCTLWYFNYVRHVQRTGIVRDLFNR